MVKTDIRAAQPAGQRGDATGFGATMTGRAGGLESEGSPEGFGLPSLTGRVVHATAPRANQSQAANRPAYTELGGYSKPD